MSEIEVFHDESLTDSSDPPAAVQSTSAPQDNSTEPAAAIRGRRPSRTTAANASKRRSPPSPSPPRQQPPSPASSYTSVFSHAPSAENWTVAGLRQVITSAGVIIPRRSSKADLLALYNSLQSGELQKSSPPLKSATTASKSRKSPYSRPGPIFTPSRTGLRPPNRSGRPSASLGRAPDVAALSPHLPRASTERQLAIQPSEEPAFASTSHLTRTSTPPSAAYSYTQPRTNEPLPYPWPAAPPLTASPTPSAQAPAPAYPPPFPPPLSVHQALSGSNLPQSTQTPAIPPLFHTVSSVPGAPFSLSTASPLPIPPNALALEPPPVANSIRSQILSEIQNIGTGGGSTPHPSTSLFRTDIPLNHPLKPLLEASLNSILQAVSPRTLQSYLTAWKSFKTFHSTYNLPFPTFSLLAITSFISHLNINKKLQTSSIKGYLSGLQFFHKLLYGSPSAHIANSQTSLLIKGIQKTNPTRPDSRQPITLKILTKCISTLRRGYHSIHTARTLDAMFILAFFGFLRCSELAISSSFDPAIHPTISDLAVLEDETISYTIKQSKTDQTKKGHFIYIFNLQSPILPYQTLLAFLHLRKSQSKLPSDPLFTDDSNRPVTRFWFQKHLKAVLHLSDTPAGNFSSHSFRIGAATTAAHKGLSQQQIQELGRWSSEAFKSYIRSDRSHIKEAHQTLIGHPL